MMNLLMDSSKRKRRSRLTNQFNDPLHLTIHQSNSANRNRNLIQSPNLDPNFGQNSRSEPDSVQDNFFSRPIPKRSRSGRPRIPAPTAKLVRNLPRMFNNSRSNNANVGASSVPSRLGRKKKSQTKTSSNSNSKKRSSSSKYGKLADEIIVINEESMAEARVALAVGFPSNTLIDEEIKAGVVPVMNTIQQANYILIRNHIISSWRKNVSNLVIKEMFVEIIPKHCWSLLDSAYNYLVSHGYINFGVAPGIKDRILVEQSKPNVIVVGAGLAGLAAARQLLSFGFKVTVLEGRQRAGGRVHTIELKGKNVAASADMGGSVLTGTSGNPLGILAQQLSLTLHKVRDECPLFAVNGKPVDPALDQKVEIAFNKVLEKVSDIRQSMGCISQSVSLGSAINAYRNNFSKEEINLFDWHLANLEYANASLLSKLSLAFWDQDDPYDMGGEHCFLPGGNGRLVQALTENVPIVYGRTVKAICYGNDRVHVHVENGFYEGDMVLCTVPLGVLKCGLIKFTPNLPQRKLDSIQKLGFGLLNKVVMLFSHAFWGTDLDTFGRLSNNPSSRGEFFLFYNYASVAGGPILVALVAGEAAHKLETVRDSDSVTRVLQILKGIYGPKGIAVPEPIQSVCTSWGSDIFSLGSYSNVAVGASGGDYDILAESVGDGRLFFAGEATSRHYPATMHGALLSGFREAANMDHYARVRASRFQFEKNPSQNGHTCACVLEYLFRKPEVEFGSFAVLFGRKNFDSKAILRVTFGEQLKKSVQQHPNKLLFNQLQSHFNQQPEFHIDTLISKQQALELREVRGDDGTRLNYLCEKFGVKLLGSKSLGKSADSVIDSIMDERSSRKPSTSGKSKSKAPFLKRKLIRNAEIVRKQLQIFRSKSKLSSKTNCSGISGDYKTLGNSNGWAFLGSDPRAKLSGKANCSGLNGDHENLGNSNGWAFLGSDIEARFSNINGLAPPNSNSDIEFMNDTDGFIPQNNGSTTPFEPITGSTALSSNNWLLQIQIVAWCSNLRISAMGMDQIALAVYLVKKIYLEMS